MEDTETMVKVTGVKFKKNGKMYYFDPGELELQQGDGVIVETARGMEFARVTMGLKDIRESDVMHPLKKVVRIADEDDLRRHEENESKKGHAMEVCREKIQKHHLDMKLIDVEFTFDNNKIIFYFTADGRVDFRDLVKDLASVFKMRIELRQVGVRDEAKMLGGIGCCGRELCCASWLADFQPVSIKMTKTQNLSLNPTKISGVCGRLMCCLKYENSTYQELRKGMPDVNERVRVGDEIGKVIETNILRGTVKVRMFTGEKDENGREKLNSEILTYDKDEVERLGKKANSGRGGAESAGMKCPCQGKCQNRSAAHAPDVQADALKEGTAEAGTKGNCAEEEGVNASAEPAQDAAAEKTEEQPRNTSERNRARDSRNGNGRNGKRRDRDHEKSRSHERSGGNKRHPRSASGKKKNSPGAKEHRKTEVVFQSFSFDDSAKSGSSEGVAGRGRRSGKKPDARKTKHDEQKDHGAHHSKKPEASGQVKPRTPEDGNDAQS